MAHALKYWWEKKHDDGKVIRLELYKKNSTAAPMEIGDVVQGLSLGIEGGEDNLLTPIVSTTLTMTFVDAYDHPNALVEKCGNWAEFYTPDATAWKVILLSKDAGEADFRAIWGGYVTPDSYEETLTYGGSVTIVARDNTGHMEDFSFDYTDAEVISFRQLIEAAWAKIESPMRLTWGAAWLECEGIPAPDTFLNVSAFKEMSWREAAEGVLNSYGAVLRYVGDNEVHICPFRYLADYGMQDVASCEPIFVAGATRMLTPAVKKIEESATYELEAELQPLVKPTDFSGNRHALDIENEIYGFSLSNMEEGKGWLNTQDYNAIYFDPSSYNIQETDSVKEIKEQMFLVANIGYNNVAEYSRNVLAHSTQVKISFGTGLMRKRYTDANGMPAGGYYLVPRMGKITSVHYGISVTQNGVTQYLTAQGEWTTSRTFSSLTDENGLTELDIPVDLSEYTGTILLKVEIGGIDATIPYVQIAAFSFGINEADELLQTNRVNTNYSEENNVIITREPVVAPAYNTTLLPAIIKNGIFYKEGYVYKPAKEWSWAGDTPQQMAVYNHLQMLAYFAKPNNVLEGTIVNADVTHPACIWNWEGKEHILVAGRFDMLSGDIEGAILREFLRYDALWGDIAGAELPKTETSTTSNIEAGAASGGSAKASTYERTTSVTIGSGTGGGTGAAYLNDLLDVNTEATTAGSVLYFDGTEWVDRNINILLDPYDARLRKIESWFKEDSAGNVYTDRNFYSTGEVSSGGMAAEGEEGASEGTLDGLQDVEIDLEGLSAEDLSQQGLRYDTALQIWKNKTLMVHHVQSRPQKVWRIAHNLGKFPNVKVVDSLKQLCFADVYYVDENNVEIRFKSAESGNAYLD